MDANQVGYVHELGWEDVVKILDDSITIKPRRQLSVQFSGGEVTKARWNSQISEFEVLRESGEWIKMSYDRGTARPRFWWR